jgi:hypothetical protein
MPRANPRTLSWIGSSLTLALLCSCEVTSRDRSDELDRPGAVIVEAANWDELRFRSRASDIIFQSTGHFYVDPNACFRKESGALDLTTWNRIAKAINRAWLASRTDTPTCTALPEGGALLSGAVEVRAWNEGSQRLIDSGGQRPCSTIADEAVFQALLQALGEVVAIARAEGC